MTVQLDLQDLVRNLDSSLNAPGTEFFVATDAQYQEALCSAFWWGRMRGFFKDYRANQDRDAIVTINGTDPMPLEVAQIIVMIAAVQALEAKAFALETKSTAKAGPVEVSTERSSNVIVALLRSKRAELEQYRNELLASEFAVYADVIDAVQAREGSYMSGEASWVM